jgi:hypothetical protein
MLHLLHPMLHACPMIRPPLHAHNPQLTQSRARLAAEVSDVHGVMPTRRHKRKKQHNSCE